MLEIKVGNKVAVEMHCLANGDEQYSGYLLIGKVIYIEKTSDMLIVKFKKGFKGHNCAYSHPQLNLDGFRHLCVNPTQVKGIVK